MQIHIYVQINKANCNQTSVCSLTFKITNDLHLKTDTVIIITRQHQLYIKYRADGFKLLLLSS